jgi:hypothetical protein
MGLGYALEVAHQKVVQALAGAVLVDGDRLHLRQRDRRFDPYNVIH